MTRTILGCLIAMAIACNCVACKNTKKGGSDSNNQQVTAKVGPEFNADSAFAYAEKQCSFGPRTMNSEAHDKCGEWIQAKFKELGCKVSTQKADLKGYDGTILHCTNIIASYNPEAETRILVCAHWDSRPWADADPDSSNWHEPVMAANDGASGVAVMIELARQLNLLKGKKGQLSSNFGVDFICFDAEDWGVPSWSDAQDTGDSWALGAQYFASHMPKGYEARYGILLDMVGGEGATFYVEGMSKQYAPAIVDKVWSAAEAAGFSGLFPRDDGGMVTDDHIPLNQTAHIPTVDIIPYYPNFDRSSFGPTWHTVDDTMEHIDRSVLKAVGQTVIQVLFSER